MLDLNEKCGVFGVYGKGLDVSRLAFYGLFALQHRGQESSGIAVSDGSELDVYKDTGLVTHVYNERIIKSLRGHIAIGHNRYSTSEGTGLAHAQPIIVNHQLALAHNGNLPSVTALVNFLQDKGVQTQGYSDSELMAQAISWHLDSGKTLQEAVTAAFPLFTGAFCVVAMTKDTLVAFRDQYGIRPFAVGKLNGGYVFASETCALKLIGAEFLREVNPGELIVVNEEGLKPTQLVPATPKIDIFEFVYFSRPDSEINGKLVYDVRRNCGLALAKENPVQADIVVPVPETAIPVAIGYSEGTGIPFEMGLIKNRYVHRTFIEPDQHTRDLGVQMKLIPLANVLRGKRVVVMDDSIVRGTTSQKLVKSLFDAGAKEVHMIISSPPVMYPDFYGIDTPKQQKLIASHKTVEEIREYLGATSLYYLSLKGLIESTGLPEENFCTSCFTGEYPIDLKERAKEITKPIYGPQKVPVGKLF
ncbi:MAG: amidophosphoribosyltransferase [Patescibacteria group bacterium]|nr:amidophosphoribosyltransferase [Patescibacteria group bacterium]